MRWILLFLGSVATGVLTIVFSLALLLVSVHVYGKYVLGIPSDQPVAWDPNLPFARVVVIGVPLVLFGLGCGVGFWFLNKRLHA